MFQVTHSAIESCDLEERLVREWFRETTAGVVGIVLQTSQTVHFIESVLGQCQNGMKLSVSLVQHRYWYMHRTNLVQHLCSWQVQYSNELAVKWSVGQCMYDVVIISSVTSLPFKLPSGVRHTVVERRSVPSSMRPCDLTSSHSGQVRQNYTYIRSSLQLSSLSVICILESYFDRSIL